MDRLPARVLPSVVVGVGAFGAEVLERLQALGLPPWFSARCQRLAAASWTGVGDLDLERAERLALAQPVEVAAEPARTPNRLLLTFVADLDGGGDGLEACCQQQLPGLQEALRTRRARVRRDALVLARGPAAPGHVAVLHAAGLPLFEATDTDLEGRVRAPADIAELLAQALAVFVACGLPDTSLWPRWFGGGYLSAPLGVGCRLQAAGARDAALEARSAALAGQAACRLLDPAFGRVPRAEADAAAVVTDFGAELALRDSAHHADIDRGRREVLARVHRDAQRRRGWQAAVVAADGHLCGPLLGWSIVAYRELQKEAARAGRERIDGLLRHYAESYPALQHRDDLCDMLLRRIAARERDIARAAPSFEPFFALAQEVDNRRQRMAPREAVGLLTLTALTLTAVLALAAPGVFAPWGALSWGAAALLLVMLLIPACGAGIEYLGVLRTQRDLLERLDRKHQAGQATLRAEAQRALAAALRAHVLLRRAAAAEAAAELRALIPAGGPRALPEGLEPPPLALEPGDGAAATLRQWAAACLAPAAGSGGLAPPSQAQWDEAWAAAIPAISPAVDEELEETVLVCLPEQWWERPEWRAPPPAGPAHALAVCWGLPRFGVLRVLQRGARAPAGDRGGEAQR